MFNTKQCKVNIPCVFLALQYVQTDIDSHKPAVDAINETAEKLLRSGDQDRTHSMKTELDTLNTRFNKINNSIHNHGDYLSKMLGRLTQLQTEVDNFEDWLMPMIDKLESRDLNRMGLLELGTTLMVRRISYNFSVYTSFFFSGGGQKVFFSGSKIRQRQKLCFFLEAWGVKGPKPFSKYCDINLKVQQH